MDNNSLRVHFIAIGGSLMHNLAITLKQNGHVVSGSDDEVFEPSRSRLQKHGLLPDQEGWHAEKIGKDIDAVILGMHARPDNPELVKAQSLGIRIYSFPEFIYEQSQDKQRIVIAGSHGKTSISAMILHVLRYFHREFDYAIGAQLEGFDTMVRLSDAPIIIIEGDEYPSSALDPKSKFLNYHHHIGLVSGISWDHINVFTTEEAYKTPFKEFVASTPKAGTLVYFEDDPVAKTICDHKEGDYGVAPYRTHPHSIKEGISYLSIGDKEVPLNVFGEHNMQNISGALEVLKKIGISEVQFYEAIQHFNGAHKRLQCLVQKEGSRIFTDFAHAPSKVKATVQAVKAQYPSQELVACLELHTFSSLNKEFLANYKGSMDAAQHAVIYYNPDTLKNKQLPPISAEEIIQAFGHKEFKVFDDKEEFKAFLQSSDLANKNLLLMSSGHFGGMDLPSLAQGLL